jgi:hypothetical protein
MVHNVLNSTSLAHGVGDVDGWGKPAFSCINGNKCVPNLPNKSRFHFRSLRRPHLVPFKSIICRESIGSFTRCQRQWRQGCHASGRPRPRPADVRTRPTIPRTSAGGRRGRPTEADGCPVRRGPSAIAVHREPSIWGRPPAPSALYDSNFSFLHYVFAF